MMKYAPADKLLQPYVGNDSRFCAAITTIPLLQPEWVTVPCEKPLFYEWLCQKKQEDILGVAVCETRRNLPDCVANLTMVAGNCLLVILSLHKGNIIDYHRNLILGTFVLLHTETMLASQKYFWLLRKYQEDPLTLITRADQLSVCQSLEFNFLSLTFDDVSRKFINCNDSTLYQNEYAGYLPYSQKPQEMDTTLHLKKQWCLPSQHQCSDGSCISLVYLSDGVSDCSDDESHIICNASGSFENRHCRSNCKFPNCYCTDNYFQCKSSGCIQYAHVCDGNVDCSDSSDEFCVKVQKMWPVKSEQRTDTFVRVCSDGRKILTQYQDDMAPDCVGGEDEHMFLSLLKQKEAWNDKCKSKGFLSCVIGHTKCFPFHKLCLYETDSRGNMLTCRFGEHLSFCSDFECSRAFKCSNAYCIKISSICDGYFDCPGGSDELHCPQRVIVCPKLFKCREQSKCIHPQHLCDKITDCSQGDDEMFCNMKLCPLKCSCLPAAVSCLNITNEDIHQMDKDMSVGFWSFHESFFSTFSLFERRLHDTIVVKITNSNLKYICHVTDVEVLDVSHKLVHATFAHNKIKEISKRCFPKMTVVKSLVLLGNKIQSLAAQGLLDQKKMTLLNLANNMIATLSKENFDGLTSLNCLNLNGNNIVQLEMDMFEHLSLSLVHTNSYHICCLVSGTTTCPAQKPWYVSCDDLLPNMAVMVCVWIISLLANIFNVISLLASERSDSYEVTKTFISTFDLAFAMSLIVLLVTDMQHRDKFIAFELAWRESNSCKTFAFMSLFIFMMSCCAVTFLSISTYLTLAKPFEKFYTTIKFSLKYFSLFLITNFTLVLFALFSFLLLEKRSLLSNSLCVLWFATGDSYTEYFVAMFMAVLTFLVCILLFGFYFAIYNVMKESTKKHFTLERAKRDKRAAKRMVCITVSNALCCLPSAIISVLSISGHKIPSLALIWTAFFVLPINLVLNPCFYSFYYFKCGSSE